MSLDPPEQRIEPGSPPGLNPGVYNARVFRYQNADYILWSHILNGGSGPIEPLFERIEHGNYIGGEVTICPGDTSWEEIRTVAKLWFVNDLGLTFRDFCNGMLDIK